MAEQEGAPSFGRKVGHRAWFSAWDYFDAKPKHAITFAVLFIGGGLTYYRLYGLPAAWEQAAVILIFTVGPIVALWCVLFVWHLWLAPAALAYEAMRLEHGSLVSVVAKPPERPINWDVWRQMPDYNFRQFAAILAKQSPITFGGVESEEFLNLLVTDARANKLAYQVEIGAGVFQDRPFPPSGKTIFPRATALAWAKQKGFDVSHIE